MQQYRSTELRAGLEFLEAVSKDASVASKILAIAASQKAAQKRGRLAKVDFANGSEREKMDCS